MNSFKTKNEEEESLDEFVQKEEEEEESSPDECIFEAPTPLSSDHAYIQMYIHIYIYTCIPM